MPDGTLLTLAEKYARKTLANPRDKRSQRAFNQQVHATEEIFRAAKNMQAAVHALKMKLDEDDGTFHWSFWNKRKARKKYVSIERLNTITTNQLIAYVEQHKQERYDPAFVKNLLPELRKLQSEINTLEEHLRHVMHSTHAHERRVQISKEMDAKNPLDMLDAA